MKKRNEEVTFKDILDVFIPKIWIIAIAAVVLAVIFGAYSVLFVKDTYTTKTIFAVSPSSKIPTAYDPEYVDLVIEKVEYKLLDDDFFKPTVNDINTIYGSKYSWITSAYISYVVRYVPLGNGILQVTVTTDDKLLSYAIAQSLISLIPNQIADENPGYFSIQVYDKPDETPAANPKGTVKNAVIGFAIGAVVSAAAVWMFSAFDIVIRNKKKIEDYFDIPVIAVIPLENSVNETEAVENV